MAERRVALVVANDRYDDPALRQLASPAADAEALAEVLEDLELGGFEVDVLSNATSSVVAEHIEQLLLERRPSDLVLMHFSCHGLKDDSGELYLAASNTKPNLLGSTAVDAAFVNRLMRRTRAQRVVLFLDCCYGGAFERGAIARAGEDVHVGEQFSPGDTLSGGRGRVVITASSAMEYAFEGSKLTSTGQPTTSVFTTALVEGIRSGAADRDMDGQVSLDELYDYVHDTVQARTPNQTPSRWEFGVQGDLVIARNPRRRIVPSPLPRELLERSADPATVVKLEALEALVGLARGTDLGLAASAVVVLRRMCEDDSKRVSEQATALVTSVTPKVETEIIDLGHIDLGRPTSTTIRVEGGPLALASTLQVSGPQITAWLSGPLLRIDVQPTEAGPFDGTVALLSPAGQAQIRVTAEISVGSEKDLGSPGGHEDAPAENGHDNDDGEDAEGPQLPIVLSMALLGSLATAASLAFERRAVVEGLAGQDEVFLAYADLPGTTAFFLLPAVLVALAALALARQRYVWSALGVIAGVAVWNLVFWLKVMAQGTQDHGVASSVNGMFQTSLWTRLIAAMLLGGAVFLYLNGSPVRRGGVAVHRGALPWVLGTITVISSWTPLFAAMVDEQDRIDSFARLTVEGLGMIAVALPVVVLRLPPDLRRFALAGLTVFALGTAARDVYLVLRDALPLDEDWKSTHFAATVAGALIPLACALLAQAARPAVRRPSVSPPATPDPPMLSGA